jgi:hypothetical protein
MKEKRFIISAVAAAVILLTASIALAVPGAIVVYNETDLGGSWQYDYTFYNTSTEGEALHEVFFYFTQGATVTGTSLPAGWHGLPWTGTYTISYLNAYSTDFAYDLLAEEGLGGFSFTVDYRAGDISYVAYFSGDKQVTGTTAFCLPTFYYRDIDGDGYGNPEDTVQACLAPQGYVEDNTDCDDSNSAIHPETLWHPDSDRDGYGNSTVSVQQCEKPVSHLDYVLNAIDYDDRDSSIGPPAKISGGTPSYYLSLQEAYNIAADGDTIQCVGVTFAENLTINADKSVALQGGYDGSYSTITGISALRGDMNVTAGTLNVENFELLQ